jgi:phosphatidylinositol kinase/protein kinase (PI-3  family)
MSDISQFEAKAYKRLYQLYKSTLLTIINKARMTADHSISNPERVMEIMRVIGDEKQWDSYGIESKQISAIIDELEKCLPNE